MRVLHLTLTTKSLFDLLHRSERSLDQNPSRYHQRRTTRQLRTRIAQSIKPRLLAGHQRLPLHRGRKQIRSVVTLVLLLEVASIRVRTKDSLSRLLSSFRRNLVSAPDVSQRTKGPSWTNLATMKVKSMLARSVRRLLYLSCRNAATTSSAFSSFGCCLRASHWCHLRPMSLL